MMDGYNEKSCNALEKPFYRPVEAALRWCGLIGHEAEILAALHGGCDIPKTGQFPRWPCLQANTERILDAIMHGNIPHGRDGKTVAAGEHVRGDRLTVRHTDLREWMAKHYPDQKPAFLFDETERKTHAAFNADSFRALQADRDALKARIEKAEEWAKVIIAEKNALIVERNSLREKAEKAGVPDERSETTYLNIIAALLDCIAGNLPKVEKHPSFASEAKLIEAIDANFRGYSGLSQSNLTRKFPAAKRSMAAQ